jgi:hypothetical protein
MMVQGPPPGWDPELNAYGPAPRQSFGMRTIQAPPAPPPAPLPEEFPALLVLKNGRMASVAKYGISGDTLYFVTPLGDSEQVPVALLDHIYPAMKQRRPVGDAAAPPASLNRN